MTGGRISSDGIASIDVAGTPHQVSHWWTQTGGATPHPASRVHSGYRYYLEVDFYTVGNAALRVGADRWILNSGGQKFSCSTWNGDIRENCQLYFSNWLRDESNDTSFKSLRFHLDG
ncbi:MAG: hypothetical protein ABL882_10105 [Sphingopyxis sp.]